MGKDYVYKTKCSMYSFTLIIQDYGFAFDLKKKYFIKFYDIVLQRIDLIFMHISYLCTHYISSSLRSSPSHDVRKPSTLDLQ